MCDDDGITPVRAPLGTIGFRSFIWNLSRPFFHGPRIWHKSHVFWLTFIVLIILTGIVLDWINPFAWLKAT